MPEVKGFRGFRFNPAVVGSLDKVVTPPYDVIAPDERAALAARSPYNMTHAILPVAADGLDKYAHGARVFGDWLETGALAQDPEDSLYLLEQTFTSLDGNEQTRRAFFGALKLPENGERFILGHERTFANPIEDRLRLTEAVRANLGAVFALYADQEGAVRALFSVMDARPPDAMAHTIDGVTQRLWRAPDSELVRAAFQGKTLYVADGHHRFNVACVYRDQMRAKTGTRTLQPYDYALMGFVAFSDPGLMIYAPHRLLDLPPGFEPDSFLRRLEAWFEIAPKETGLPEAVRASKGCAIGLAIRGRGRFLLTLRPIDRVALLGDGRAPAWRDLDVAVLHRGIIERILGVPEQTQFVYEKDADKALATVERGEKGLAFLLRAVRPEQMRACAEAYEPMPQKSTYFFPKLPTGMVIHRLV